MIVPPTLHLKAKEYADSKYAKASSDWAIAYNGYVHGYMIQGGDKEVESKVQELANKKIVTLPMLPPIPGLPKV